jgi:uncharacterized protein YciI
MRIAYFYLMRDEPDRVRAVAPAHAAYWDGLRLPEYVGGPLADRSGGLITFECESLLEADSLVVGDPFVRAELLESAWVKEWLVRAVGSPRDLRTAPIGPTGR